MGRKESRNAEKMRKQKSEDISANAEVSVLAVDKLHMDLQVDPAPFEEGHRR